jgi:hypothetical protein
METTQYDEILLDGTGRTIGDPDWALSRLADWNWQDATERLPGYAILSWPIGYMLTASKR